MFIIADIGSNWVTKEDCFDSVFYASKTGADAVKFQLYDHKKLYGFDGKLKGSLPKEWVENLYQKAHDCGIEFMITPFHHEDVQFLDRYVKRWKIASSDLTYIPLLEAVAATTKPVILSVGASSLEDIERAVNILMNNRIYLMYCVSSYPSTEHDLNYIELLYNEFQHPVGYSDHSTDVYMSAYAAKRFYNCAIYEKHLKVRDMDTPDAPHSLTWWDFRKMVNRTKVLGPIDWKIQPSEKDMLTFHNRRLVAIKDIKPGDFFILGVNYGYYRTKIKQIGLPISDHRELEGLEAKSEVMAGRTITQNDI